MQGIQANFTGDDLKTVVKKGLDIQRLSIITNKGYFEDVTGDVQKQVRVEPAPVYFVGGYWTIVNSDSVDIIADNIWQSTTSSTRENFPITLWHDKEIKNRPVLMISCNNFATGSCNIRYKFTSNPGPGSWVNITQFPHFDFYKDIGLFLMIGMANKTGVQISEYGKLSDDDGNPLIELDSLSSGWPTITIALSPQMGALIHLNLDAGSIAT